MVPDTKGHVDYFLQPLCLICKSLVSPLEAVLLTLDGILGNATLKAATTSS